MSRYLRVSHRGQPVWARREQEAAHLLSQAPWFGEAPTGEILALSEVKLLAPAQPGKILCVGINYRSHLLGRPAPEKPELFYKPPSALIGPGEAIVMPEGTHDVHFEGELVAVIGRHARHVVGAEARACVFGYMAGNDVSARDWQANDRQWWRAKGCDTFAPVGPELVTGLDLSTAAITTRSGDEVLQQGVLSDLIFDLETVIAFASRHLSLEPGDLLFTGTPGATRAMRPGETITIEIAGLGALSNPVISARRLDHVELAD